MSRIVKSALADGRVKFLSNIFVGIGLDCLSFFLEKIIHFLLVFFVQFWLIDLMGSKSYLFLLRLF